MKYILSAICLLLFCSTGAFASEITGKISTDPKALIDDQDNQPVEPINGQSTSTTGNTNDNKTTASAYGGSIIFNQAPPVVPVGNKKPVDQPKVLGIELYPDGSLLRDENQRIFLIKGQIKKPIRNLLDLQKYQGQAIHDVTSKELATYQTQNHLDGELIRKKGTAPVYVIDQGRRRHILNLQELRKYYFGQEIFNISEDEMSLYP
jgi:hypothetical protein